MINIPTNKFQTPITEELLAKYPDEVKEQFLEFMNTVPYLQYLVSPNRKRAKDLDRDKKGRIIVDIVEPHILEDMDYFTPSANHYNKYGFYTHLRPNGNPTSEYGKWLRTEITRCWEGYVRESDGEWIPGALYFYMNYGIIILAKEREGTKIADRILSFPQMWEGIYIRFHYMEQARSGGKYNNWEGGQHGAELASRGKSKSYSMASIMTRNFILGENKISSEKVISLVTAYQKQYLLGDGVLDKFIGMIDFCAKTTQFPRKKLKASLQEMTWKMGYRDTELEIDRGTQNTVIGVSSKDDESKLRGKRAAFIGIEEFGTFPRLIDLYNILLYSVTDGDYTFGMIYLQGTAGDKDSDFAGAEEIMYNPRGYNMYGVPNVYDKVTQGKKDFVMFFPGYLNRKGCYNKDGVSDVVKATLEILAARYVVKYNVSKSESITKIIAEVPITPAEAVIKVGVNLFPVIDLVERLGQLDKDPTTYDSVYSGALVPDNNNKIVFKPTGDIVIRNFPHKASEKEAGAVEILTMPIKNSEGKIPSNRYIAGCDPYDDDSSGTTSLGSFFIHDMWTDLIVAEFTGRPSLVDDFYETGRRLCLFYNAKLNYENNKKGLYAYFLKMNSGYIMTDGLEFLKDKDMIKDFKFGNKSKGTNASESINNYARERIRSWLCKPITIIKIVDDKEVQETIPQLYLLKSRALIKELIAWNSKGNFDRISAVGMLMLLRESQLILSKGDFSSTENIEKDYLGLDPFFDKNYDSKFKQKNKQKNINL